MLRLRVKDVDFEGGLVFVRAGKGDKDRSTLLAERGRAELREHLRSVKALYEKDREAKVGPVWLPDALAVKYPAAGIEWTWQWVFPKRKEGSGKGAESGGAQDSHGLPSCGSPEYRESRTTEEPSFAGRNASVTPAGQEAAAPVARMVTQEPVL